MRKFILFIAILLLAYSIVSAQDAHSSQYGAFQNYSNPALVAATGYRYNVGLQYRSQWANIASPYRNMGAYYSQQKEGFGFGLSLLQNDAGEASLKTLQAAINGAYQQQLGANNYISAGASFGLYQKSFNPEAFTFDSQYVPGQGADPSISSGESFDNTNLSLIDFSAGILWNVPVPFLSNTTARVGLSLEHINQPNASFDNLDDMTLPMRSNFQVQLESQIMDNIWLFPFIAYAKQGEAKEWTVGTDISFDVNESTKVLAGFAQRQGDAFILKAGFDYKNVLVGISYDMNTSALQTATNGNGAIELNASLRLEKLERTFTKKKKKARKKKIQDPQPIIIKEDTPVKNDNNDRDGDGIANNLDECPDVPGLIQFNGCRDTDKDGVYDHIDECPNLFGVRTNRGCPQKAVDSDGDGLIDTKDNCPFLKGLRSMGGCPDTDRDGISDIEDYCPYMKGKAENKGCPVVQSRSDNFEQVRLEIHFDTDQSIIKERYLEELYEMAFTIKSYEYGSYRILIEGHTDAEGDTDYNFRLGERRAIAIKDFFVRQGIAPSLIETVSYGEYKPQSSNRTDSGKYKNRRTEVKVMLRN